MIMFRRKPNLRPSMKTLFNLKKMNTQNDQTKLSIKNLRQKGWKVRVLHERNFFLKDKMDSHSIQTAAKGGRTEIQLTNPDKTINASGVAVCSDEDNYNRKVGNSIALGRAWKKYEFLLDSLINV
jgi:hypothetical protein